MQQRKYRKNNGKTMRTEYYIRNINTNAMNAKMKYYALSLLFTVLSVTQLWAYDFNAVSPSGHRLYYTITSNTAPRTVEIVPPAGNNGYSGYTAPSGNVVVPETVTYLGNTYRVAKLADRAFYHCTQISTLSLPTSLKYIGDYACYNNGALTSVAIPDSVTSIGVAAFQYNRTMTSAVLPAQLQTIGNYAFYGNSNLSSISTIPTSVTSIGTEAFHNTAFYNNSSNWTGDALYKDNCLLAVKTTATGSLNIRTGTRIIANAALKLCDNITSVSIPNTMIYIGENAFEKCFSLTSITIPHSVSYVGKTAFKECTGLNTVIWNTPNADINHVNLNSKPFDQCPQITNFIFGDSVRVIPGYALYNFVSIQTLSIGNNVDSIGYQAFHNCNSLTSVDLSNVETIGDLAFEYCSGLTSVDLGNLETIGGGVFYNCNSLTSVDLSNVETIGSYAFYNCSGLTTIDFGNVETIGNYAFSSCSGLTSVDLSNVETIGNSAFSSCSGLTSVVFPESVSVIGNNAFENCDNLLSVEIPSSINSIGGNVFKNCDSLATILWNTNVLSFNNVFSECNNIQSLTIGDSVRVIPNSFMDGRSSLRIVSFGANVDTIGNYAFRGCSGLTSVVFPESVSAIGNYAFENCDKLLSVEIPSSINSIGGYAFKNCDSLRTVMWNTNAFISHQSNNSGNKPFEGCISLELFVFGDSVRRIYDHALGWGYYGNQNNYFRNLKTVIIGNNIDTIGTSAFESNHNLDSVRWGNSVTTIGDYAFHSTGLKNLTIPSTVETLNNRVFENCDSLLSIEIPSSVTTIGGYVFYHCDSLRTVVWNTNAVAGNPFNNCLNIQTLTFGDSVLKVQNNFMDGRSSLHTVTFGANVDTIGSCAFRYCNNLISVDFSEAVSVIGDYAFQNCSNLDTIVSYAQISPIIPNPSSAWYNTPTGTLVLVPCGSGNAYRNSSGWNRFTNIIDRMEGFDLNLSINNENYGSAEYDCPTQLLEATPIYGYRFAGWNDGNTDNPRLVEITQDTAFEAIFEVRLPCNFAITSGNAVRGSATGSGTFLQDTVVTISATPNYGYHFAQWSDGDTNNPRNIVVMSDTVLTAMFEKNTYELAGDANEENRGVVNGIGNYLYLDTISITATANYGYHFSHWNDSVIDNPRLIQIFGDTLFTAVFEKNTYTLSANVDIAIRGNVDGVGNYLYLDNVDITAEPNYGYHFAQWSDGDTNNPRNIMVMSDTTLTAIFDKNTYNLSVNSANTALGTVVGGGSFEYLDTITIIATAIPGYEFYSWDDGDTNSIRRVVVTESKTYTATFGLPAFYLVVNANDTAMGRVTGRGFYVINSLQQITATANSGYHFVEWSDGNTNRTRSVRMVSDTSFTAIFAKNTYNISITNNARGVFTGAGRYEYLDTATISVVPNYGYSFVRWNDGDTNATRQVVVTANRTYTATFSTNSYTINVVSNDTTMGTVSGAGTYTYNTNRTITATPTAFEYCLLYWSDGSVANPRTIRVLSDTTYYAVFGLKPTYTLTVLSNNNAVGTVTGSDTAIHGTNLEISATANYGYHFARWSDGNTQNPRTIRLERDTVFTAIFERNTYNLTTNVNSSNYGSVAGGGNHLYLDTVSITATPNYGYHFTSWNDGDTNNPRQVRVMSDTTFTAVFDRNTYSLACSVNVGNRGNVSGAGNYLYRDNVSIAATSYYGYHFTQWSDGNTQNPRTIRLERDTVFTAIFERNTYSISGAVNVQDRGSISGVGNYLYLDSVSITANANYGYHFTRWSDGNTDNPRIIQITKDSTLTAVFDKNTYTVSANANFEDRGTVTGSGAYLYKERAQISAAPKYGYNFARWNDGNTHMPRVLSVLSDVSFTAIFEPIVYKITVGVAPGNTGRGTVVGGANVAYKDSTTIKAYSLYGYHFNYWSDGNTDSIRTVEVLGNANYYANFAPNQYTLNLSVADEAMGTVVGNGSYDYLTEVQIRANSKSGYFFSHWSDGRKSNPRVITLERDIALTAYFTDTYVGIEEAEELENLAFYPNPTEGTITFNNQEIKKVEVLDAMGRVVAVHKNSYIIDLSKLNKGLYTLRITLPQGVTIRKVVRK